MYGKIEPALAYLLKIYHNLIRGLGVKYGVNRGFANRDEYRSDSENSYYASAVLKAINSDRHFDNFKRDKEYKCILEHVTRSQGKEYLEVIASRNDNLLERAASTVFRLDNVGNPIKYSYEGFDYPLSPTTLRYLKVASDLKGLFGENLGNVAEIGCGYGGQALVNDQLLKVRLATLFDLPTVNKLISRYLNAMLLNGAYRVVVLNEAVPRGYDLVISNYAFSELPFSLQQMYIEKVLANSSRGYLTMNSGIGGKRSEGKMSLKQLRSLLPPFEIYEEVPLTSPHNYLIVWGHNKEFAGSNLADNLNSV